MIDRTNIGISPLMSTPMTTSYITSPGVDTTSYMTGAITQPIEYVQTSAATPQTFTTTQVVDQGFALPETTTYLPDATSSLIPQTTTTTILPDAGITTSFAPQTTLPDQALTSFIPDVTPSYLPTTDIQPISVMPDAGLQTALTTPTVSIQSPEIVSSTPLVQAAGSYTTTTLGGTPVASSLPVAGSYTTTTLGGTPVPPPLPSTGTFTTTTLGGTPVPPPGPQNGPIGPIMDEDFQRGRPIYDEFSEDRYRGFRFGR